MAVEDASPPMQHCKYRCSSDLDFSEIVASLPCLAVVSSFVVSTPVGAIVALGFGADSPPGSLLHRERRLS
ncbi:hypothetical protein AHAS_Ahas10G0060300 [Arachis hypogaea]